MTNAVPPRTPRPTLKQLGPQVSSVAADLPSFLTAPLFRRWHLRWGTTPDEVEAVLPGDELLPHAQFRCTRAITIQGPPALVWPWLVQVGCLRAGFYSNDLLDNLGHPSARNIVPELQQLEVGQWIPMSPKAPSDVTAFRVERFEVNQWLLWHKPDSTWAWKLTDTGHGTTRLDTRVHATYQWKRPVTALLGVVLMEFGDFAMMRRMLRGIKERAETLAQDLHLQNPDGSRRNLQCSRSSTALLPACEIPGSHTPTGAALATSLRIGSAEFELIPIAAAVINCSF